MTQENNSIFTPPETPAELVSSPKIELPPEVLEFVGEGKKYSNPVDALKSVPHAQKHISTLEAELVQTKTELEKRRTAEELLNEIKSSTNSQTITPVQSGLTEDAVVRILEQKLVQKQVQEKAQSNAQVVATSFAEKFGDKAEEVYNKLATDSGLTVTQLNTLAATAPSAVLKLAGLDNTIQTISKSTGTINTETMKQNNNQDGLSARVRQGASTKDLVNAWKIAGQKIGKQN